MTYRRKSNLAIIAAALLTVALLLGLGCGREASMALSEKGAAPTSSMRQSSANTPTNAAAESGEMLGGSKAAADGTLARRKIITRGEIALTVKTYATSRKSSTSWSRALEGSSPNQTCAITWVKSLGRRS